LSLVPAILFTTNKLPGPAPTRSPATKFLPCPPSFHGAFHHQGRGRSRSRNS
jgi:hypothetical protein